MELVRGIVHSFDPATWRASVELLGAPGALLAGVPVSAALGPHLLAAGTPVWLCLEDMGGVAARAVLAPMGGAPAAWVTSRLWKPARASAERSTPAACTSTTYTAVSGLSVEISLDVRSSVLLLLAACGHLDSANITYYLAFFHDDGYESTQLTPQESVGGTNAANNENWGLSWFALQEAVAPGTHTFVLKHRVSAHSATLQRGRIMALAMAE